MDDFEQLRNKQAVESVRKFADSIMEISYSSGYGQGYYDACKFILMLLPPERK